MESTSISLRNRVWVTGFGENTKISVLWRQCLKNHPVNKVKTFGCGSRRAVSDVRRHCNQLTVDHNDHKEGRMSSTVYGWNRGIKYGTSTWYYSRKIERKEKRQRVRNGGLQKRREIEEGWEVGSNIEVDGDMILAGMLGASVSWVETRWGLHHSSRRPVGKNTRKAIQHLK